MEIPIPDIGAGLEVQVTPATLRKLVISALLYVALSALLFLTSLSITTVFKYTLVAFAVFSSCRALLRVHRGAELPALRGYTLRLDFFLLFVVVLALSSTALFLDQGFVNDWSKHRTILWSLFEQPVNPVLSGLEGNAAGLRGNPLVYYYGQYLPASRGAEIALVLFGGVDAGPEHMVRTLSASFFAWNLFGLCIAVLLLPAGCRTLFGFEEEFKWGSAFLVMLAYSGLAYWSIVIKGGRISVGHAEWGAVYFANIPSLLSHWQWAPQHLVPAMLVLALVLLYREYLEILPLSVLALYLISSSPFSLVGFAPLVLYLIVAPNRFEGPGSWTKALGRFFRRSAPEVSAAAVFVFVALVFYSSRVQSDPIQLNRSLGQSSGVLWYFVFLILELLPAALVLLASRLQKRLIPPVIWISIGFIAFAPLFELGRFNDFSMRATIPATILLLLYCAGIIQESIRNARGRTAVLLFAFFVLCIPPAVNEYVMGLRAASPTWLESRRTASQYDGTGELWLIGRRFPEPLFRDGFESRATGAWSGAVPGSSTAGHPPSSVPDGD